MSSTKVVRFTEKQIEINRSNAPKNVPKRKRLFLQQKYSIKEL